MKLLLVSLLILIANLAAMSRAVPCTLCGISSKLDFLISKLVNNRAKDCADIYVSSRGSRPSGVYTVYPRDGLGGFRVYCDMTTDGGGWTVFQKRLDGSVNFFLGWQDYKHGFGHLMGEFWLGNDKINRLTKQAQYKLRVDMESTTGEKKYAVYSLFAISSESTKYQLSIGTYSGNAGDSLSGHRGAPFSTKDNDNDSHSSRNCATSFKGAWWYTACHGSNLNGFYHHGAHTSYADGVNWYEYKGYHYSLKSTSMKIRPVGFIP